MIVKVFFYVMANVLPNSFDKQRMETRAIDGEFESIDKAFESACNAGAIPNKPITYQYA
jgi:hypothetical protein